MNDKATGKQLNVIERMLENRYHIYKAIMVLPDGRPFEKITKEEASDLINELLDNPVAGSLVDGWLFHFEEIGKAVEQR
ncbi:MAG: hypothetical protein A2Z24_00770 [Candidatus Woykebacteria bacterium RBG_16_44_10]|uniref:Uncharacterized protein n=1 Tax=Candidatus Woykebacteria bacterium RBG_16_44_10 TaxID=1802597 RepID=A0A1G1WFJ9_9BACT|nr:MAG: hypothetical protein A2Z24_00770 [Candidatus Woykebacteria bacterium RBG_16_44_10]